MDERFTLDDPATMTAGTLSPVAVPRLPDAQEIKAEAKAVDPGDWYERSALSHPAAARYLGVPDGDPRTGVPLPNGEIVTVHSLHHGDVVRFRSPVAFWPVTDDPRDYLIAASVRSNPDGTSSVALWGVLTGDEVRRRIAQGPVHPGKPSAEAATAPPRRGKLDKASPYIEIPLRDFDQDGLDRLRQHAKGG